MRLSEAFEGFRLHLLASGYSNDTVRVYSTYLKLLCKQLGDPDIVTVTSQQLVQFMGWLASEYKPKRKGYQKGPVRPSTLSNTWSAIRSMFKWHAETFKKSSGKPGNSRPDLVLARPKNHYEQVQPFSREECERLVKAARQVTIDPKDGKASYVMHRGTGERNTALVMVLLDTGMRVGELCRLRVDDLDLVSGELTIRPFGSGQKTSGRHVYIGKASRNMVWKYLAKRKGQDDLRPGDPLFATVDGKYFDRHGVAALVTRIGKRASVSNVHPHRFRHTAAIQFLRNGGNGFALQKMLGHTDMEMTRRYVMYSEMDLKDAARQFGVVDTWKL